MTFIIALIYPWLWITLAFIIGCFVGGVITTLHFLEAMERAGFIKTQIDRVWKILLPNDKDH